MEGWHTIVLDRSGRLDDIRGEAFFIDKSRSHLYTDEFDESEFHVSVYDLKRGKTLFYRSFVEPIRYEWYTKGGEYFFTTAEFSPSSGELVEKRNVIYKPDFQKGKIVQKAVPVGYFSGARDVLFEFAPAKYKDCDSRMIVDE